MGGVIFDNLSRTSSTFSSRISAMGGVIFDNLSRTSSTFSIFKILTLSRNCGFFLSLCGVLVLGLGLMDEVVMFSLEPSTLSMEEHVEVSLSVRDSSLLFLLRLGLSLVLVGAFDFVECLDGFSLVYDFSESVELKRVLPSLFSSLPSFS